MPGLLVDTGTVNGGLLPDIRVVDEGILRFGHFFTGADNVFLGSEATALRLLWTDAAAPGRIRAENVFDDAVDLFLGRPAPGVPDPVVSIVFSSGNQTGPGTMGLELRTGSTAVVLGVDVAGVGASGWLARGFLAGQQQWEVAGSGSALGESAAWPIRTRMTQDALEVLWAAPVDLDPAGGAGQNLAAVDRLEIVPVQPTLPLPPGKTADLIVHRHERIGHPRRSGALGHAAADAADQRPADERPESVQSVHRTALRAGTAGAGAAGGLRPARTSCAAASG